MKTFVQKFGSAIADWARLVTSWNVNTICWYAAHQPKLPPDAQKLRKF